MTNDERTTETVYPIKTQGDGIQLRAAAACWRGSEGHEMTVWRLSCGGLALSGRALMCSACGAFGGFQDGGLDDEAN